MGTSALFSLGHVIATPAALAPIKERGVLVRELLHRHLTGDWQEMCQQDQEANWAAIPSGKSRVFSAFNIDPKGQTGEPVMVWDIAGWDRSVTAVLRPYDYWMGEGISTMRPARDRSR